jgi:hypothetical protein
MTIKELWTTKGDPTEYEGMPVHPGRLLFMHVVAKTTQVGAAIGATAGAGANLFGYNVPIGAWAARGALIGAPLGVALILKKATSIDADGITDRGFRLAHNKGQNAVDAISLGGLTLGLLVSRGPPLGLSGAALGVAAGAFSFPIVKKSGLAD